MSFVIAFLGALFCAVVIIISERWHGKFTFDDELSGVRRFHNKPVPRIGGLSLLIGLAAGGIFHGLEGDNQLYLIKWAGVAALPVFLGGLFEDVLKNVQPRDRLLLAFLSAAIAYYELDCGLQNIGWTWFDNTILPYPGVSLVLTILMLGGVSHAANIVDGFNGLLIGLAILALLAFGWVAYLAGLNLLLTYIGIVLGALLGLFLFNFPNGRIFLGDGGAYLVGFVLALIALLLVKKSGAISPWFPLLVLIYPVCETIFSMYRKKVVRNRSISSPDGSHLHMLIYGRVVRHGGPICRNNRNPATSIVVWILSIASMVPAVIWWNNTSMLLLCTVIWIIGYLWLYSRIVRFRLLFFNNVSDL